MTRLLPRALAPVAALAVVAISLFTAAPAFAAGTAALSGYVYVDANDNGVHDNFEAGIHGVTLSLTGTDSSGNPVNLTTSTGVDGSYLFAGVPVSNSAGYTVTETQPAAYLDGKDAVGTSGGTAGNDVVSGIVLVDGATATDYTFGELQPASLSGFAYVDSNDDGVKQGGESGIANVTVRFTGTNDLGVPLNLTTTTAGDGSYAFSNLRPSGGAGYTITETQPAGLLDGKDTAGTLSGTVGND